MSRRYRKRKDRRWIGVTAGVLILAAVTAVLINMFSCAQDDTAVIKEGAGDGRKVFVMSDSRASAARPSAAPEERFLVLINEEHPNPDGERPSDLVRLDEIFFDDTVILQNPEGSVDRTAGAAAKQMLSAAYGEGVGRFMITTAYRSVEFQDKLYEDYIEENANAEIGKVLPGYASEHATGLAIDILSESHPEADDDFFDTAEGRWLYENAHRFGFILRYPRDKGKITGVIFEPWHYRYVGKAAAKEIYERGICLEEYLSG